MLLFKNGNWQDKFHDIGVKNCRESIVSDLDKNFNIPDIS